MAESGPLLAACDTHLRRLIEVLAPEWVIGVGAWAEQRASTALAGLPLRIGRVLHPSPANPRAHDDWSGSARGELEAIGLCGEARRGPKDG